ncbi:hypothetical protein [Desulfatitalea tepidiphila]|uniref:hypothetical protein n=1 Tax=Desulfatitalea tepidiphila TaxID=1185843 RepID=UPI0006B5C11E|nr:hypothetical protein [Desulfatitalea tepidiphila]
METEIFFNQQANTLQGRLAIRSRQRAAIITHPLQRFLPYWQPTARLHVIESADHFFGAELTSLQTEITTALMG